MSIWKEIKYALNSTVGTSKFMPIDKLIKSSKAFLSSDTNVLYSKPINETLSFYVDDNSYTGVQESEHKKIIPKISGTVKVRLHISTAQYVSGSRLYLYVNDTLKTQANSISVGAQEFEMEVPENEVYDFYAMFSYYGNFGGCNKGTRSVTLQKLEVLGTVTESYVSIE